MIRRTAGTLGNLLRMALKFKNSYGVCSLERKQARKRHKDELYRCKIAETFRKPSNTCFNFSFINIYVSWIEAH
ncbi:hypothetical protein ScPMuIL_017738 [Solemya velum]